MILFTSLAMAQEVNSLLPILEEQAVVIDLLEEQNFIITDVSVGMVFDGTEGHSVPVELFQGETVVFVGVGDALRIADLDIYVFDSRGTMLANEGEADAAPVLEFTAPSDGVYDVRVAIAEPIQDWNGGFFALTTAVPIAYAPITVMPTFDLFVFAVETMESSGMQVIHGEFEVLMKKEPKPVPIYVADWSACMAIAVADPNRNKKLHLSVHDPYGSMLAMDKRNGELGMVFFQPGPGGLFEFRMNARKMRRFKSDTHAMVVVGCM